MDEPYPTIDCDRHGRQETVLQTRYERRSKPRDVPDRFVCIQCTFDEMAPDEGNSIRIGPDIGGQG